MNAVRWRVEEFDSIDSTNRWLKERAVDGEAEGLVARADFQTAGRGRLDRRWEAPPRSALLTSILLRPAADPADVYLNTVAVALAARDALVRLCGVRPELKWPNDLVVDDAKLGGVLAESLTDRDGEFAVVVGIGVNLTSEGPDGVGGTSIRHATGITLDPRAVLDLLIEELDHRLELWRDGGRDELHAEFTAALTTLGRDVRVERATDVVEGRANSIDQSGRLQVVTTEGVVLIETGDVVHLRSKDRTT